MGNFKNIVFGTLTAGLLLAGCASTGTSTAKSKQSKADIESLDSILSIMGTGKGRDAKTFEKQLAAAKAHPLGDAKNPVRVWRPAGQQAYLNRLVCSNGKSPTYSRDGNVGPGPYGTIIDLYSVVCSSGTFPVYMDMYHLDHEEDNPVPGFKIRVDMGGATRI